MTSQTSTNDQDHKPQIHIEDEQTAEQKEAARTAASKMNPAHLANMQSAKDFRATSHLLDKRALEDNRQQGVRNTSNNHDHESGGR